MRIFQRPKKLNARGAAHILIPGLAVLAVAVVGTFMLVSSHANAKPVDPADPNTTTYYIYSAKGTYKKVAFWATGNSTNKFPEARCNAYKIGSSGVHGKAFKTPAKDAGGKYKPLVITCVSPKDQQAYTLWFEGKDNKNKNITGSALGSNGANSCVFVHVTGITHIVPKTNGVCAPTSVAAEDSQPDPAADDSSSAPSTTSTATTQKHTTVYLDKVVLSKDSGKSVLYGHLKTRPAITAEDCNGNVEFATYTGTGQSAAGSGVLSLQWDTAKKSCVFGRAIQSSMNSNGSYPVGTYKIYVRFPGNNTINQNTHTPINRTVK